MSSGSETRDALIGTMIGSYRVQSVIGAGGMGTVYELVHPGIHKRLALKVLHHEYAQRADIVQRFFDEARAVNLVGHPNIVDIIDYSKLPDGRPYITMEYLRGESLGDLLTRRGSLSPSEAVPILEQVCSALGAAHAAGIVHRDLKPDNIFLEQRAEGLSAKILDFGIAKLRGAARGNGATETGVVLGTPIYMSPEQAAGRTREVDNRTDIYSLGVITFQMLSGKTPFSGSTYAELILKHLNEQPPELTSPGGALDSGWKAVVARALAKDPEGRFPNAEEFARALRDLATSRAGPRSKKLIAVLAASGVVAAGAVIAAVALGGEDHESGSAVIVRVIDSSISPSIDAAPPTSDATPIPDARVVAAAEDETADRDRDRNHDDEGRRSGKISVKVVPWAIVYVDGKRIGQTPVTVKARAGTRRLRIVNESLGKSERHKLEVRPGKTAELNLNW